MLPAALQEVADWLRQQQAAGRLAAAVLMPQHSCAAGQEFAMRVLNAHMPVAFPGLGAGGFQEAVMMRGTGFAKLNLMLELAVARWAAEEGEDGRQRMEGGSCVWKNENCRLCQG
jgi:hypothetical protein